MPSGGTLFTCCLCGRQRSLHKLHWFSSINGTPQFSCNPDCDTVRTRRERKLDAAETIQLEKATQTATTELGTWIKEIDVYSD